MKYPMRCPDCKIEIDIESPIDQGPPANRLCVPCAIIDGKMVYLRRVFSAAPVIFRGSGWAGKS